jgi:hypothetical protein
MKNALPFSRPGPLAALLSLALAAGGIASAQNSIKNPDFEQPLGVANWTVVYPNNSSEADWYIHGRSTLAHRDKVYGTWDGNYFGAHLRPYSDGLEEAYFTQIVTNLLPGSNYLVSCWSSHFQSDAIAPNPVKVRAWIESVGGNGTVASGDVSGYCYLNNGWLKYNADNTADANGQIEVHLRVKKTGFTSAQKWISAIEVFFDHAAVMPAWNPLPAPFSILSVGLTNQAVTLKWETVMNNTYRVDISSDLENWSTLKDNLGALGTNMTFTTNLFAFDPTVPQFFRVLCKPYVP